MPSRRNLLIAIPETESDANTAENSTGAREEVSSPKLPIEGRSHEDAALSPKNTRRSLGGLGATGGLGTPCGLRELFHGRERGGTEGVSGGEFFMGAQKNVETIVKTRNAFRTLRHLKFFQDMETGVQEKLAKTVQHASYKEGTVIFRQGDPPGSCYIILSGEIGIFQKNDDEAVLHAASRRGTLLGDSDADVSVVTETLRSPKVKRSPALKRRSSSLSDILELLSPIHVGTGNSIPTRTAEGFSFYSNTDDFGAQVATFNAGRLIGELALQQDAPRSATVKCLQESEFLVISRKAFDAVMKEEMARVEQEKIDFLKTHVPGVRELPPGTRGKPHASYFFRKVSYNRGHVFLTQGTKDEECIYVLVSGAVEFQRRETSTRPMSPTSSSSRPGTPATPTQVAPSKRSNSAGRITRKVADDSTTTADEVRRLGVLLPGGLFGSLSTVVAEPFTVTVVSGPCEIFCVSGIDVRKLPNRLLETIRDYLIRAMTWRLEHLKITRKLELPSMAPQFPPVTRADETKHAKLFKAGKVHAAVNTRSLHRQRSAPGRPSTSPGGVHSSRMSSFASVATNSIDSRSTLTGGHSRMMQALPGH